MGQTDHQLLRYVSERRERAEAGGREALYDLGLLYSTGHGVDRDFVEAHKWFNLAAIKGVRRAEIDRTEVAQEMDNADINRALKLARDWLKKH